jgi:hypothetical protein
MTSTKQAAAFRVARASETLDLAASSVPQANFEYVASVELVPPQEVRPLLGRPAPATRLAAQATAVRQLLATAMQTNVGSYASAAVADSTAIN